MSWWRRLWERLAAPMRPRPAIDKEIDQAVDEGYSLHRKSREELVVERNIIELWLVRDYGIQAGKVMDALRKGLLDPHDQLVERWIKVDSLLRASGEDDEG